MSKLYLSQCLDRHRLSNLRSLHQTACRLGIYRRSFRVAVVVGTLLNLINQPQALFGVVLLDSQGMHQLDVTKALLTYAVPFLVATYGALTAHDVYLEDAHNEPPC